MRRDGFLPGRRRCGALLVLVLGCAPFLSCFQPESTVCRSGRVCAEGLACAAIQNTCIDTPCGDGIVQEGEVCDDGNILDGDGCSRDCTSSEECGNGKTDLDVGEVCDDGNIKPKDGCSANCRSNELCGNSITDFDVGEVCDDGNTRRGDGCNVTCSSNETCGNGVKDSELDEPEVCDDGNRNDGDQCSSDCRSTEGCGNGIRDVEEECDDNNKNDEDNCLNTCRLAICGDGVVDRSTPRVEQCDTGGESASCNVNCTLRVCGDGIVNASAGETCDLGRGPVSTSECDGDCTFPRHGDGFANSEFGEQCDDGNLSNQDNCLATWVPSTCGDRFVDREEPVLEACDDGNQVTELECPYGTPNCIVCRADCGEELHRVGDVCGNGIPGSAEACDDGNANACGTCNATCSATQLARATGTIRAIPSNSIVYGNQVDNFSINDGLSNVPVTFEFDMDGNVRPGRVPVPVASGMTAMGVAQVISDAINGVSDELKINAIASAERVLLTHESEGSVGNQSIAEAVNDKNFIVTGMAGGKGYDCPAGVACKRNADCARELVCLPEGVCGEPPPSHPPTP
jgi:cysteine-rich repeat protein